MDDWLRVHALRAQGAGVSRTTVWTAPGQAVVVAYHAIAPAQFARAELPSRALSGGFSVVPGFLIGRLALDVSLHGQGLGGELLHDALRRIVAAADTAGGRIIAVDALDDAARSFYRRHDFQPLAGSDRLVIKVSTARAALARDPHSRLAPQRFHHAAALLSPRLIQERELALGGSEPTLSRG